MKPKHEYHVEIYNSNGNQIHAIIYTYTSTKNFKYFQLTRKNSHLKNELKELKDAYAIKVYEKLYYGNLYAFIHTQKVKEII